MTQNELEVLHVLLSGVDTVGTIGLLVSLVFLFYSGRIVSSDSIRLLCESAAQETIRCLQEDGTLPQTKDYSAE